MTNIILYNSSLVSLIIHNIFFIIYKNIFNHILFIFINLGLITSILNHKYTNIYLQFLDKFYMFFGTIFHILFLNTNFYLLFLPIFFYFFNKFFDNDYFHLLAHAILTFLHLLCIVKH